MRPSGRNAASEGQLLVLLVGECVCVGAEERNGERCAANLNYIDTTAGEPLQYCQEILVRQYRGSSVR